MRFALLVALIAALLASCAAQGPLTKAGGAARTAALTRLHNWTAEGRLAVNQGQRSWQATFHWHQQGDHYAIDLIGPLGQGQLNIRGGPTGVTLRDDQQTLQAKDPEALLVKANAPPVPVRGLRYWLLGEPDPHQPARPVAGNSGYLRQLQQSGWTLTYPNYIGVHGLALPQRIQAERGSLQVKVFVGKWTLR